MYKCILDRAQLNITSGPESPENFQNPDCPETGRFPSRTLEFSNISLFRTFKPDLKRINKSYLYVKCLN